MVINLDFKIQQLSVFVLNAYENIQIRKNINLLYHTN